MENTIKFKEMVKLIHPDINPTIKDPSLKMNDIILYKNDPEKLYTLGVKWGIIKDFDINWYYNKWVSFKYGDTILNGIVVSVDEIKEPWAVENMILEISVKTPIFRLLKLTSNKNFIKKEIKIEKDATPDEIREYSEIKKECIDKKVEDKPVENKSEPTVNNTVDNDEIRLVRNFNYYGMRYSGWFVTKNMRLEISRTTAKRVYYYDVVTGKERYVKFENVVNIERH